MGAQEKKALLKELIETGKAKGKLTTKELSDALEELDYDVEQVDKLYDMFEQNNIEIVEDMITPVRTSKTSARTPIWTWRSPPKASISTTRSRSI